MDPSKPFTATPTTKTPSKTPPHPPPPVDLSASSERISYQSAVATPSSVSPSAFSSSSLLSPCDPSARSALSQAPHSTPRRIPSASSLRDERRKSTPSLKKHSSAASLRSSQLNSAGSASSPRPSLSRRSSSTTLATSPTATATLSTSGYTMSSKKVATEQLVPTAASIAADHFKKEVSLHQSADLQSQTLVIIHDACYGHRFSRPRTSRAALGSIVERPERIQACVVGISAAYVRLARRHAGGQFAPHPYLNLHQLPVPPFQIRKTTRTLAVNSPAVTHVHGSKWMEDLRSMCDAAESRLALNGKELVRPRSSGRDSATGASSDPPFHEGDLYLCSESLDAFEGALGGVCEGVDAVFNSGPTKRAFVCIRPPGHHCSSGHPSGFCWINNVHVGISYAAMTHGLTHAAILDFDLHHGDGSQDIACEQNYKAVTAARNAAAHKKTMIGYFSLHDINSYPCEMGEPEKVRNASVCIEKAHGQSIWNVHLEPWKTEQEFWELYSAKYSVLIDRARAFLKMHTDRLANAPNGPPPKAAVFISAGFDASEWEGAGMQRHHVNVPTEFYAKFSADVVRMAEEEGLGVDGRIISVLEGGYSNRALTTGVLSHLSGLGDSTQSSESDRDYQISRLATEMKDRLGLSDTTPADSQRPVFEAAYDREWWSPPMLEELEALVYPAPPVSKPREKSAPTYFAPTQSFAAKVVLPTRDRKSTGSQASPELEPLPLPPVSWAVATHELSKVLIPSDRQTTSCRPEDLNAEASRLRRERQAAIADAAQPAAQPDAAPAGDENKMKLRMRKPKPIVPSSPRPETPARRNIRVSRRTTIDSPSVLPDPSRSPGNRTRRKSAASTPTTEGQGPEQRPSSQGSASVRKPGTSRSATPKGMAGPQKVPPVPQVPSTFRQATPPTGEESPGHDVSHAKSIAAGGTDDVDSLTSEVRKLSIKLNVPSPEENAARERRAAEERRRKAKTSKGSAKAALPKKTPTSKETRSSPASMPTTQSSADPGQVQFPPLPDVSTPTYGVKDEQVEDIALQRTLSITTPVASSPASSGIEPKEPGTGKVTEGQSTSDVSSRNPYAGLSPPPTPGPPSHGPGPQSILYSPLVSAPMMKHGLPVFTSKGPIPFAPSNASEDAKKPAFGSS